jgi:hypothetical protein
MGPERWSWRSTRPRAEKARQSCWRSLEKSLLNLILLYNKRYR